MTINEAVKMIKERADFAEKYYPDLDYTEALKIVSDYIAQLEAKNAPAEEEVNK